MDGHKGRWPVAESGASSIVVCGDGSHSDLYILALSNTSSYVIKAGALTITLDDGRDARVPSDPLICT